MTIKQLLHRPFHKWHNPDKAVYIQGVPGYSLKAQLKVCDICGKLEIIEPKKGFREHR